MFAIEKNIDLIRILAVQKQKESHRFRMFLKQHESPRIEHRVDRIHVEVADAIDYTKCGNCCTILRPFVTEEGTAQKSRIISGFRARAAEIQAGLTLLVGRLGL